MSGCFGPFSYFPGNGAKLRLKTAKLKLKSGLSLPIMNDRRMFWCKQFQKNNHRTSFASFPHPILASSFSLQHLLIHASFSFHWVSCPDVLHDLLLLWLLELYLVFFYKLCIKCYVSFVHQGTPELWHEGQRAQWVDMQERKGGR